MTALITVPYTFRMCGNFNLHRDRTGRASLIDDLKLSAKSPTEYFVIVEEEDLTLKLTVI